MDHVINSFYWMFSSAIVIVLFSYILHFCFVTIGTKKIIPKLESFFNKKHLNLLYFFSDWRRLTYYSWYVAAIPLMVIIIFYSIWISDNIQMFFLNISITNSIILVALHLSFLLFCVINFSPTIVSAIKKKKMINVFMSVTFSIKTHSLDLLRLRISRNCFISTCRDKFMNRSMRNIGLFFSYQKNSVRATMIFLNKISWFIVGDLIPYLLYSEGEFDIGEKEFDEFGYFTPSYSAMFYKKKYVLENENHEIKKKNIYKMLDDFLSSAILPKSFTEFAQKRKPQNP